MTKKQPLAAHVGEWVQVRFGSKSPTKNGIIAFVGLRGLYETANPGEVVGVYLPKEGRVRQYHRSQLVLRDDRPRAWTPNGNPPAGKWIYSHETEDGSCITHSPTASTTYRAWAGDEEEYHP